mmetsp:Transcript_1498/g.5087  ORF Transcript_1498/g.5087 Transcript_1498/m.5087 type:complete len:243 (+) Transcript_1498:952-1680(+)
MATVTPTHSVGPLSNAGYTSRPTQDSRLTFSVCASYQLSRLPRLRLHGHQGTPLHADLVPGEEAVRKRVTLHGLPHVHLEELLRSGFHAPGGVRQSAVGEDGERQNRDAGVNVIAEARNAAQGNCAYRPVVATLLTAKVRAVIQALRAVRESCYTTVHAQNRKQKVVRRSRKRSPSIKTRLFHFARSALFAFIFARRRSLTSLLTSPIAITSYSPLSLASSTSFSRSPNVFLGSTKPQSQSG